MNEFNYIHLADMGKLFEVSNSLAYMREKRVGMTKVHLQEVPREYNSLIQSPLHPPGIDMALFAMRHNINEMSLNATNEILYRAANEHEDIAKALKALLARVILSYSDDMQETREKLKAESEYTTSRRDRIIAANKEKERIAEDNSTAFRKKIKEANELLVIRKQKLIRSLNTALEKAGNPENLAAKDYEAFKLLRLYDWVGFDGSFWCCKEPAIMDSELSLFWDVAHELLAILKKP